jgi:hypothetical protein
MIEDEKKRDRFADFLIEIGRNVVVVRSLELDTLVLESNTRKRSEKLNESPGKSEA